MMFQPEGVSVMVLLNTSATYQVHPSYVDMMLSTS